MKQSAKADQRIGNITEASLLFRPFMFFPAGSPLARKPQSFSSYKGLNSYKHSALLMTTCGSNKSGLFQKKSIHPTEEISAIQGGVGCGKKKLLKTGCLQMTSCNKPDF